MPEERKLVSILFADTVGSEAASLLAEIERLAPPPPWNYRASRRRALAAALGGQATRATRTS